MSRTLKRALNAWLRLEDAGGDRQAEEALYRLFVRLPRPSPAPGFVEAVLRRAGLGGAAPAAAASPSWSLRLAAGLALALGGVGAIVLPALLAQLLPAVTVDRLADFGARVVVLLLGGLPEGVAVWRSLSGLGRAVAVPLQSPPIVAALLSSALLCLGAFHALRALMISERSTRHVGTL